MDNPNLSDKKSRPTREDRLAEQLRQNLRRRKMQAKALDSQSDSAGLGTASGAGDTSDESGLHG